MFGNWLKIPLKKSVPVFDPVAPDAPFIAVGDIHGRHDLLERLLLSNYKLPIVCVGDYVDRGDHSADVLTTLQSRSDITCLMGNHEEMMLNFLEDPERNGPRWLRYGGLQTLASFGVSGLSNTTTGSALVAAREALVKSMGPDLVKWLGQLPTYYKSGNVVVLHAGADPAIAIPDQQKQTLRWGHPEFGKTLRRDGVWIVHGHTIVDEARAIDGIISIDTGAYATGRLTTAWIKAGDVTFKFA